MKKSTIIGTLNDFPKEIVLDDFLERLIVIEKIEEGLKDVDADRTISHKKLKNEVKKWLK